jgi:hypothetical protein
MPGKYILPPELFLNLLWPGKIITLAAMEYIEGLAKILQTSISPVALISGIGLILLSMTNRLGRTIDRIRILAREIKDASGDEAGIFQAEIKIIYRRARILQIAITFAASSAFLAALIVFCLFGSFLFHVQLYPLVIALFTMSLMCLIISLALFLKDLTLGLQAVRLDAGKYL